MAVSAPGRGWTGQNRTEQFTTPIPIQKNRTGRPLGPGYWGAFWPLIWRAPLRHAVSAGPPGRAGACPVDITSACRPHLLPSSPPAGRQPTSQLFSWPSRLAPPALPPPRPCRCARSFRSWGTCCAAWRRPRRRCCHRTCLRLSPRRRPRPTRPLRCRSGSSDATRRGAHGRAQRGAARAQRPMPRPRKISCCLRCLRPSLPAGQPRVGYGQAWRARWPVAWRARWRLGCCSLHLFHRPSHGSLFCSPPPHLFCRGGALSRRARGVGLRGRPRGKHSLFLGLCSLGPPGPGGRRSLPALSSLLVVPGGGGKCSQRLA